MTRGFWLACVVLVFPLSAKAAVPVAIRFADGLQLINKDAVRRVVEIELRNKVTSSEPGSGVTTVDVAPVEQSRVRIAIDDAVTGKTVTRTIDVLAMGKNGSSRLLGVAIVELLSASWAEVRNNPKPEAVPVEPLATPEVRREVVDVVKARAEEHMQLSAMALVRGPYDSVGATLGAGVRYVPSLSRHLVVPLDVTFEHGSNTSALGRVGVSVIALDAGLAWQSSRKSFLRLGGGIRGGAARYAGAANDASVATARTIWAPWVGPFASASIAHVFGDTFMTELILEGGYALTPTRANVDQGDNVALRGPWVGLALAIGARIPQ